MTQIDQTVIDQTVIDQTGQVGTFDRQVAEWYEHFYTSRNMPHDVSDVLAWALTYLGYNTTEDGMASSDSLIQIVLTNPEVGQVVQKIFSDYSEMDGYLFAAQL